MRKTHIAFAAAIVLSLGSTSLVSAAVPVLKPSIAAQLAGDMPRTQHSATATYFVLTDRYANGDTSNDNGSGSSAGGFNPSNIYGFHGGDFVGMKNNLQRVKDMGFSAIWITPPVVQNAVQGGTSAYHGYWGVDFTTVDPRLGTEAEFKAFVDHAHELGMKVIMDIVLNHTADTIQFRSNDYNFKSPAQFPYKNALGQNVDVTKLAGLGLCRQGATTGCFPDLELSGFPNQAYVPGGSPTKAPDFLNDVTLYHNRGGAEKCGWVEGDCSKMGDFFGLDDLMTEDPRVVEGLAEVYGSWITRFGIDGFRIDTAKHTDDKFFPRWLPLINAIAKSAGKNDFTYYGEAWYDYSSDLIKYAVKSRLQSLLDFPSRKTFTLFAAGSTVTSGTGLLNTIKYDDYYNLGGTKDGIIRNAYNLTTFLGNHDEGRGNSMIATKTQATGDRLVERVKLGNSILFLLRGTPVVYYGDELGMISNAGDAPARQDLMPTQVAAWQTQSRIGSDPIGTANGLDPERLNHPIASHITALQNLRAQYPALVNGAVVARSSSGMMASWSKFAAGERREFVVAVNGSDNAGTLTIPTSSPSRVFSAVFGTTGTVSSTATGSLKVTIPPRSAVVYRANKLLPAPAAAPALKVKARADYRSMTPVFFVDTPTTRDPISVTFVARNCSTCAWFKLGTDDAKPFQIPVMPEAWASKKSMQVAAISRTSNGKVAGGQIVTFFRAKVSP